MTTKPKKAEKSADAVPESDVEVMDPTAAKAEASDADTVTVDWNDQEWEVPTDRRGWDIDAMIAVEEGKFFVFLKLLLGPAQWRRFTAGKRRTVADADELTAKIIADALGANQGE